MNTVIIPAKKVMGPDTNLMEIDNIWDYIALHVEEDSKASETNNWAASLANSNNERDEDSDDWDDCYDDSWEDYDGPYMSDNDWDYYDAFEGESEAVWGREW
jgi:hypothetical protein